MHIQNMLFFQQSLKTGMTSRSHVVGVSWFACPS